MTTLFCYCDGGYNRDIATGYGSFSIHTEHDTLIKHEDYDYITSSTDAEYRALISLLTFIKENYPEDIGIVIYSDSKIMVNQLNALWKVSAENLVEPFNISKSILTTFKDYVILWIPRKLIVKELGH